MMFSPRLILALGKRIMALFVGATVDLVPDSDGPDIVFLFQNIVQQGIQFFEAE